MPPTKEQEINYAYFQRIQPELLADPLKENKFVIIYDEDVKGIYDTFATACREAYIKFKKNFIVQEVFDENKRNKFLLLLTTPSINEKQLEKFVEI